MECESAPCGIDPATGCMTPGNWHRVVMPIHSRFCCGRVDHAVRERCSWLGMCSFAPDFTAPGRRKIGGPLKPDFITQGLFHWQLLLDPMTLCSKIAPLFHW